MLYFLNNCIYVTVSVLCSFVAVHNCMWTRCGTLRIVYLLCKNKPHLNYTHTETVYLSGQIDMSKCVFQILSLFQEPKNYTNLHISNCKSL